MDNNNQKNVKPPLIAAILLLITFLGSFKYIFNLFNHSDLISRILSIDWLEILLASFTFSFIYLMIVVTLLIFVEYFNEEKFKKLTKSGKVFKIIIPLAITTSFLLIMTIEQIEFFAVVAALSIIFQIYYHLVQ